MQDRCGSLAMGGGETLTGKNDREEGQNETASKNINHDKTIIKVSDESRANQSPCNLF